MTLPLPSIYGMVVVMVVAAAVVVMVGDGVGCRSFNKLSQTYTQKFLSKWSLWRFSRSQKTHMVDKKYGQNLKIWKL